MAIHETKKQSDLEKRLKLLRQQLYGKDPEKLRITQTKSENQRIRESDVPIHRYSGIPVSSGSPSTSEPLRSDITYLYQDLVKIGILATLALGTQLVLFFLMKNQILNINLL